ncbi:TetR/AcrR family transcriptional regulator [Hyphobacterium sp. HN65]|uniref:TetR/AcrR family transcriptional regulator n=1 Tax=Hyphobacterium lacteum TaxID=3116575 RepID=A0ABU7LMR9_9PROT|nr:TetR/AcrR family transcriptional regulator [Hyphobacterium sp. HN65]MEE2525217.1 TetR/AcrR family transcriptional regulator [Hyphobacterium sp. HN65]
MPKKSVSEKNMLLDRRSRKTRASIVNAVIKLWHEKPGRHIRVADIINEADVGRSTFYQHFTNRDEVCLSALRSRLEIFADLIVGAGDGLQGELILADAWAHRRRIRENFPDFREKVAVLLADLVEERLQSQAYAFDLPVRLVALQLAESCLAVFKGWIDAEAYAGPDDIVRFLKAPAEIGPGARSGRADVQALERRSLRTG